MTPDGFPLAYVVMDGNTSEHKTLRPFLNHIEKDLRKSPAGVGDGSRDTDRSHIPRDAGTGTGDVLSGGNNQRPDPLA